MKTSVLIILLNIFMAQNLSSSTKTDLNQLKTVVTNAVSDKNKEIAAKNAKNLEDFKSQIKTLVESSKNQIENDSFFKKHKLNIQYSKYCKINVPKPKEMIPPVELECLKAKEDAGSFMKLMTQLKGGESINVGDVEHQFVNCVLQVKTVRKSSIIYKDCLKQGLNIFTTKHLDELKKQMTEKGYAFDDKTGNFVKNYSSGWKNAQGNSATTKPSNEKPTVATTKPASSNQPSGGKGGLLSGLSGGSAR